MIISNKQDHISSEIFQLFVLIRCRNTEYVLQYRSTKCNHKEVCKHSMHIKPAIRNNSSCQLEIIHCSSSIQPVAFWNVLWVGTCLFSPMGMHFYCKVVHTYFNSYVENHLFFPFTFWILHFLYGSVKILLDNIF